MALSITINATISANGVRSSPFITSGILERKKFSSGLTSITTKCIMAWKNALFGRPKKPKKP